MKKKDPLGQFEQLVLTAILLLRENAYGMSIADKVSELGERPVSLGAVYLTLERMEDKGFITSWLDNPTADRRGRERRYYRLMTLGEKLLNDAAATAKRIYQAVEKSERMGRWKPSRVR